MELQMKINGDRVRALREAKSWSQEHLARASGLSGRTIQRVEVEGIGSAETRLALAAALGVPVSDLMQAPPRSTRPVAVTRRLPLWGWIGWGLGIACSITALSYGYRQGVLPLEQIALNVLPWLAVSGLAAGAIATGAGWRRNRRERAARD